MHKDWHSHGALNPLNVMSMVLLMTFLPVKSESFPAPLLALFRDNLDCRICCINKVDF